MDVNFGRTAADYGRFRAGFPDALFARLQDAGVIRPGLRVLDLGTGSGSLGRGFARRGCAVVGLDLSPDLMAEARRLDGEAGVESAYLAGTRSALPPGRSTSSRPGNAGIGSTGRLPPGRRAGCSPPAAGC